MDASWQVTNPNERVETASRGLGGLPARQWVPSIKDICPSLVLLFRRLLRKVLFWVRKPIGIHPGQYFDEETGLHYNWNRYYNPETGRYTQVDPIGFYGEDANIYRYVRNNVTNKIDPYGLMKCESTKNNDVLHTQNLFNIRFLLEKALTPYDKVGKLIKKTFELGVDVYDGIHLARRIIKDKGAWGSRL